MGIILYLYPLIIVLSGNSKNILKPSETNGYKPRRVSFLYILKPLVKSFRSVHSNNLAKRFPSLFKIYLCFGYSTTFPP